MDHPFLSQREELNNVKKGIGLLQDIFTILTMNETDKMCLIRRVDDEIENDAIRDSVCRHSTRLGLLLRDVDNIVKKDFHSRYGAMWSSFLRGGKEIPSSLLTDIEHLESDLKAKKDLMEETEMDDRSSSYSDYSASSTDSNEECDEESERSKDSDS